MNLKPNSFILFQGDSVTDAGRSREDDVLLGSGYPSNVAALLAEKYSSLNIRVLNRGISGNRSRDLVGRWQEDCLDLAPDIVSILIGVNDTWRRYDSNDPTSDESFEANLRKIIGDSLNAGMEVVLINPFLLDVNEKVTAMREDLCGKQAVVKRLAAEFGLKLLDMEAIFSEKSKNEAPSEFSADGVHPSAKGHAVIADEWLGLFA